MQRALLPLWLTGSRQGGSAILVLAVIYIVLMILWAIAYLPGTFLGPNSARVGIGVQFVLFAILGWVLFAGVIR